MVPFRTKIYSNFCIADLLIPKSYCLKLDGADTAYYRCKACYTTKYLYLTNL